MLVPAFASSFCGLLHGKFWKFDEVVSNRVEVSRTVTFRFFQIVKRPISFFSKMMTIHGKACTKLPSIRYGIGRGLIIGLHAIGGVSSFLG